MALINCPDCRKPVSDAAPACLDCGRPIAGPKHEIQTIEATGKLWKVIELLGALLVLAGAAISIRMGMNGSLNALPITLWMVGMGFLIMFVGAIGAWWFHG